ncbi:MAG: patatin-like phospholipase family protein [Candidatus Eisenbacteria bacterium]
MTDSPDNRWFTLARQPQEPLSQGGATLVGADLAEWRRRFRPLLRYLARRETVLALSGGGMAMSAHASILRVLELLGVSPTRIYGTSAGAVIGGFRAAGMSTADIEAALLDIRSADALFGFASRYPALRLVAGAIIRTFVRPSMKEAGIYDLDRVEGHIEDILTRYVGGVPTMGELELPFYCVAVDIGTGASVSGAADPVRKVVFSREATPDVRLSDAIGASMSIPGVITPKRLGGRYYIDGAALEHLPVLAAYNDWTRRRKRFPRSRLAIVASDLGYAGETLPERELADPIDLVVHSRRLQERAITYYNLLMCHRPRRRCSVIMVRPGGIRIELHEVTKMRACLHSAYEGTVEQLSGRDFLRETNASIERAGSFLGLPGASG